MRLATGAGTGVGPEPDPRPPQAVSSAVAIISGQGFTGMKRWTGQEVVPTTPSSTWRYWSRQPLSSRLPKSDGPVLCQGPVGVVCDLPHVPFGIGEGTGIAAPFGALRRSANGPAGALGVSKQGVDLLGRPDVMRELHSGRAMTTEGGP